MPPGDLRGSQEGWCRALERDSKQQKVQRQGRAQPCCLTARDPRLDWGKHFDVTVAWDGLNSYTVYKSELADASACLVWISCCERARSDFLVDLRSKRIEIKGQGQAARSMVSIGWAAGGISNQLLSGGVLLSL
jgi:hypothetical protein